jgi:hypothetical protein
LKAEPGWRRMSTTRSVLPRLPGTDAAASTAPPGAIAIRAAAEAPDGAVASSSARTLRARWPSRESRVVATVRALPGAIRRALATSVRSTGSA